MRAVFSGCSEVVNAVLFTASSTAQYTPSKDEEHYTGSIETSDRNRVLALVSTSQNLIILSVDSQCDGITNNVLRMCILKTLLRMKRCITKNVDNILLDNIVLH